MSKSNISTKKLKAIVFTDIVDFTKLSADDEQKALDIIDKQRELLKPIVLEHKGEWLKEIGDGLLFSFDSSLDAVNCSIKIQQALKDVDEFKIRIGIHQGEIFVKDGDVYGDDVNIASRVEGFSPEGGISISDKVYKDIQGVKTIKTSFIGHKSLKGVNQETKVRCITSNSLPNNHGNKFPEFIGFSNIYLGIVTLFFSIASGFFYSIYTGLLSGILGYSFSFDFETNNESFLILLTLSLFNLSLILILFGISTLSFRRGVSIFSQKMIYYSSIIYSILLFLFIFSKEFVSLRFDEMEENITPYLMVIILFFTIIIYFTFKNFRYKNNNKPSNH